MDTIGQPYESDPMTHSGEHYPKRPSLFWKFMLVLCLGTIAAQAIMFFGERLRWQRHKHYTLFKNICSNCHDSNLPKRYAKSPRDWQLAVQEMIWRPHIQPSDSIDDAEKEQIVSDMNKIQNLMIDLRSLDAETLYSKRCGRCHELSVLDPYLKLHPDVLAHLIRRHVGTNNMLISYWEGELITEYVLSNHALSNIYRHVVGVPSKKAAMQMKFQKSCSVCHTVEFIYRGMCQYYEPDGWPAIIKRMREKTPGFISVEDVAPLVDYTEMICTTGQVAP